MRARRACIRTDRRSVVAQPLERSCVFDTALRLPDHRAVPFEAERASARGSHFRRRFGCAVRRRPRCAPAIRHRSARVGELAIAAISEPKCNGPVGEGAKRPRYRTRRTRRSSSVTATPARGVARRLGMRGPAHRSGTDWRRPSPPRVFGPAQAAVVPAERAVVVALFDVDDSGEG